METIKEEQDEDVLILQLDRMNAFNCVERDACFHEVKEHFPDMLKRVLTCYGQEAVLMF